MAELTLRPVAPDDVAALRRIRAPEVRRWWGDPEPGWPGVDPAAEPAVTRWVVMRTGLTPGRCHRAGSVVVPVLVGPAGPHRLRHVPSGLVNRSIGKVAERVPGVRRIPVVALLSAGEVALLAKDHVQRLTPAERRRLVRLVRIGRGRRDNLTAREREELERLLATLEPRELLGAAADRLSPVPLPRRLTRGRHSG